MYLWLGLISHLTEDAWQQGVEGDITDTEFTGSGRRYNNEDINNLKIKDYELG
jgi:hypothetical protein